MDQFRKNIRECEVGDFSPMRPVDSEKMRLVIRMPAEPPDEDDKLKGLTERGLPASTFATVEWIFVSAIWEQDGVKTDAWKRIV
ncbi:hypothetical protein AYO41_02740 [Verrucomicrobia bacterium SCGC AG-212-E04]|nr:hypothetical protein AYO41_02740 [Verrucomicrobia bacterium SCGC AG-212-E04]